MATRVFFFFSFLAILFVSPAQDTSSLMRIKHRLLQRVPDELQEHVDSFHSLHIVIGGNIYQTEKHINYAYDTIAHRYDFKDELKYVQPLLNIGDISIANLKTSFANDSGNIFSTPDEFAAALKYAGISALMHANQQTANINKSALQRTRELLNNFDINHTGAFLSQTERLGNYPLILHKKGFTIAVLNYTNLFNRPEISNDFIINEISKFYIDHDMLLARANKPDFIIVYFNWGDDKQQIPSAEQRDLAQFVFDRGANLVVGTAPNKPLPIEYVNYTFNGRPGEGIAAFSLGNLVASSNEIKNRDGYLLDIDIKKNEYTGQTNIDDWGVVPVYTYYDTTSVKNKTKIYSVPCWAVESGDIFHDIPYIEKRRAINGAYEVRQMLGSTADEIQYNLNEQIVNNVMEAVHLTRASLNNKFSQLREQDIKISPAPVAVAYLPGTNIPLSLALVAEQYKPKEEPVLPGKAAPKTAQQTAYEKEKSRAENVFSTAAIADRPNNTITQALTGKAKTDTTIKTPPTVLLTTKTDTGKQTDAKPEIDAKNQGKDTVAPVVAIKTDTGKLTLAPPAAVVKSENKNTAIIQPPLAVQPDTSKKITAGADNMAKNNITNAAALRNTNTPKIDTAKTSVALPPPLITKTDTTTKPTIHPADIAQNSTPRKPAPQLPANTNPYTRNKPAQPANTVKNNPKSKTIIQTEARKPMGPINPVAPFVSDIENNTNAEINSNLEKVNGKQIKMQVDTFYRIQFYALVKYIPLDTNYYTHLKGYQVVQENGLYKYLLGKYVNYNDCYKYWRSQIRPRYKQSFIVKYIEGKRVIK